MQDSLKLHFMDFFRLQFVETQKFAGKDDEYFFPVCIYKTILLPLGFN